MRQVGLLLQAARQMDDLRRVPRQINEGREEERRQIAQELHDTIQQFLGALPYHLDELVQQAQADNVAAEALLDHCLTKIEEAARHTRLIQRVLKPTYVENGLRGPLEDLADRFTSYRGLPVTTDFPAELDETTTLSVREAIFRIVDQALENVVKHAHARHALVRIEQGANALTLTIQDDGCGIDPRKVEAARRDGHLGIEGMRSRLSVLGGTFDIEATPPGTTLRCVIPLLAEAG